MKLAIALASAALLTTTSAFAADLAPAPVEPVTVITPYDWTGFYIGVHAGADIGQGKVDSVNFNGAGFIGGIHAGYNYQFDGPWVVGLETDIDYSSFSKSDTVTDGAGGIFRAKFKNEWQGSTRARVGYAFDRFLPYITGGVAYGDEKISGLGAGSDSQTRVGWTAGGGLEYAIYDNWLVRGEVRYVDLGSHNFNVAGTRHKARFDSTNITLGVSYKF